MVAFDRCVPPGLDLRIDLLVEVGHCRGRHLGTPQGFGDVLDPPDRNTGQVHLDQRFLYAALTSTVTLDDSGLEGLLAQLRHLQLHFASLGLQAALVVAGARILAGLTTLVAISSAQAVRLSIQHRVQGFLNSPAHHLAQVVPDPSLIEVGHVPHRLVFSLVHCRSSQSERNQSKNQRFSSIFSDFLPAHPPPPKTSVPVLYRLCASNPRPTWLPRHPHHGGAHFGRHQRRDEFCNERDQFREWFGRHGDCGALQKRSPLRLLSCVV